VAQATSSLYGAVTDIEMMTGGKFESQDIIYTANTLEELSRKLSALSTQGQREETSKQQLVLKEIQETVGQLRMQTQPARLEPAPPAVVETIKCPECNNAFQWFIGTKAGFSASPVCPACGQRFHAHRRGDGEVFTRKPGAVWASPP
jgi:predicted RNA-binding Zn ribbon-like protein